MSIEPEAEWEATISRLLSQLPAVDPPIGFIARAIDRRPLYATRTTAALALLAGSALAVAVGFGGLRNSQVVPRVDAMAEQHSLASASIFGSIRNPLLPPTETEDPTEIRAQLPQVELPSGLEPRASFKGGDLRQAVFAGAGTETVSVFFQPGLVDFEALPAEGYVKIADVPAWIDAEREITIIQAKDEAVTIVGLSVDEMADVVGTVPTPGVNDKITEAMNTITAHLGFPDLD